MHLAPITFPEHALLIVEEPLRERGRGSAWSNCLTRTSAGGDKPRRVPRYFLVRLFEALNASSMSLRSKLSRNRPRV
jgi:hypothetical protein